MCKIGSRSKQNKRRAPSSNSVRAVCYCLVCCWLFFCLLDTCCVDGRHDQFSAHRVAHRRRRTTLEPLESQPKQRLQTAQRQQTPPNTLAPRAPTPPARVVTVSSASSLVIRRAHWIVVCQLWTLDTRRTSNDVAAWRRQYSVRSTRHNWCVLFCEIYLVFSSFVSSATSLSDARKFSLTLLLFVSWDM